MESLSKETILIGRRSAPESDITTVVRRLHSMELKQQTRARFDRNGSIEVQRSVSVDESVSKVVEKENKRTFRILMSVHGPNPPMGAKHIGRSSYP